MIAEQYCPVCTLALRPQDTRGFHEGPCPTPNSVQRGWVEPLPDVTERAPEAVTVTRCRVCGNATTTAYCSGACKQKAYRRQHAN